MTTILTGDDGRDRARSTWHACNEVIEHPDAYRMLRCAARPGVLEHLKPSDVVANAARGDSESSQVGKNIAKAFATWRAHVTEVEAQNAARLFMLASTLRTLADLHARSSQPAVVLARISDLGEFVEHEWGVAIPLSDGVDVRAWAQRATRRLDLLSLEMREL